MQALIFADRLGRELESLTDRTCAALLPVLGKPMLEHTLEALGAAGLSEAVVAVSPFADELRLALGDGGRWGMRLHYVLTRGEEDPDAVVENCQSQLADELLALRGDVLHGAALSEFLRLAAEVSGPVVYGRAANAPVSLCLHRAGGRGGLEPLRWSAEPVEMPPTWPVVEVPGAVLNRLESLYAYHRANLDAAAGRFPGLIVPGQQVAPRLTVGPRSRVLPRGPEQGVIFVGENCRVEASAEFYGEVVIANRVTVDRHAILRDSVVLSDAYIGERLEVRNAIIQGNRLIQVDTGAVLSMIETFTPTGRHEAMSSDVLAAPFDRLWGLLLLLLSLPLWLLALVAALVENFDDPLRETRLRGNRLEFDEFGVRRRRVFVTMEWMTSIPVLRHLPRLLAVVSGDLRLVGAEPPTPEQATDSQWEDWARLADRAPAGLIGPTQLILPAGAPRETRLMSDVFYACQRGAGKDLRYLLLGAGALFTPRAWWLG